MPGSEQLYIMELNEKCKVRRGKGVRVMRKTKVFALLWAFGLLACTGGMTALAAEQDVQETTAQETSSTEQDVKEQAQETPSSGQGVKTAVQETASEAYVSRIVSFTDCTGMRVTYDANASRQYVYQVENGVLTDVKVKKTDEEGNTVLEANKFEGTVELQQPAEGEKYTSIAADLFGGNTRITYVKLPAGVTKITAAGFKGCTALKSVYLPSTVKTIEKEAFQNCTAMTQIAVPKSVTTIGNSAFKGDAKLQTVYFRGGDSAGLTSIGANAFPTAAEAKELVIKAAKGGKAEAYAEENGLAFEENKDEE